MRDLFTNGENHQDKTPQGEFKVTTPENPLLWKQAVTVGKFGFVSHTKHIVEVTNMDLFHS